MRLIIITRPDFFPEEAVHINALFRNGLEILHLRKPHATITDIHNLLKAIQPAYYPHIVLHDGFSLIHEFPLKGIHLNGRNPQSPPDFKGSVSCSCHSLPEVSRRKEKCDYVFLSPIYDSISKKGYASAFSQDILQAASDKGIIDHKVFGLSGINASHIPGLKALHFGGVALLGTIWKQENQEKFITNFLNIKALCDNPT